MNIQNKVEYQAPLSQAIVQDLAKLLSKLPPLELREEKNIVGSTGFLSIADLIAYQIGWGTFLIRWYEEGVQGLKPHMPGNGFMTWDYNAIAESFYHKYHYDAGEEQINAFNRVLQKILQIIETEYKNGTLDKKGVWPWCTLTSGTKWPLSKWISVNVHAPCKRTIKLISRAAKEHAARSLS